MKLALRLAYFDTFTTLHGWQIQPNVPTIEQTISNALKQSNILPEKKDIEFTYAGRTDQGVNALSQIIAFDLPGTTIPDRLLHRINAFLPYNIKFWAFTEVDESFHPRYCAYERVYKYIWRNDAYHSLDTESMKEVCQLLQGDHDFTNFSKHDPFVPLRVRTLTSFTFSHLPDGSLIFTLHAPSFLWQQCRRLCGHVVQIGKKEADINITKQLLSLQTSKKPNPLPPEFLTLVDVKYHGVNFQVDRSIQKKFLSRLSSELAQQERYVSFLHFYVEVFTDQSSNPKQL